MNIAEKYFKKQLSSEEFRRSFLEEKVKLDIEYKLEELKRDIQSHKSPEELIKKSEQILKRAEGVLSQKETTGKGGSVKPVPPGKKE